MLLRRILVLGVCAAIACAGPAAAKDIFVTTTTDGIANNGNCTLREAIKAANTNSAVDACPAGQIWPVDVIVLTAAETPYRLTVAGGDDASGDLDIWSRLDIAGAPSTIDATGLGDRILDLRAGAVVKLLMVDLRGGNAGAFKGGGIYAGSGSSLVVFGSSIRGNRAALGAGIAASGATVKLHDSDVSSNAAAHGIAVQSSWLDLIDSTVADNDGAGITAVGSTVNVTASTISGNTLTGLHAGGGTIMVVGNTTISDNGRFTLLQGGGVLVESPAVATLYYSTVADNKAAVGGGVAVTGTLTLEGTIVGANHASSNSPDCWSSPATIASQGFNLVQRDDCSFVPLASDKVGSDPQLDALADWGGPTRTRRLLQGSPALDGGNPADFPPFDQRAEKRPRHGDLDAVSKPDIGAHENGNTIVVDTNADVAAPNGKCSLRDAIRAANTDTAVDGCRAGFDRDLIWIPSAVGDVFLALGGTDAVAAIGDLDVLQEVDVAGAPGGGTSIDGGPVERVFEVHAPARLHLAHLEVTRGFSFLAAGGGLSVKPSAFANLFDVEVDGHAATGTSGGGALVEGELMAENVWFHDNATNGSGGGIALDGDQARLVLRRSRVTANRNTVGDGGGIAIAEGRASLYDTTVADNLAAGDGGGIHNEDTLELVNVTVAHNRADSDSLGGGAGGGVDAAGGTTRLASTLIAGNLSTSSPDCAGTLDSSGYNLIADVSCSIVPHTGDQLDVDAGLAASFAGIYTTVPGSLARDAGSPDLTGSLGLSCGRRDGIGIARPVDSDGNGAARCDIGAIEGIGMASLDVDGDGKVTPLGDGLLILRYMLGVSGDMLVSGAVATEAPRSTSDYVIWYLSSIDGLLDVDGNTATDALTDAQLIMRYLLGFRGSDLTEGVLGAGATRTSPAQIAAYLDLMDG